MGVVRPEQAGAGSAVNDATREVGGTLGVAVLGSVYSTLYLHGLSGSASLPALLPSRPGSLPHPGAGSDPAAVLAGTTGVPSAALAGRI